MNVKKIFLSLAFVLFSTLSAFSQINTSTLPSKISNIKVGSVYWSPYHHDGNNWVGPIVYYFFSKDECFVRASGIHNRFGGERVGHIVNWELNGNALFVENHEFSVIGEEVLKSNDRVFFKAKNISEAYNLIYLQTTTTVGN
jgi:hypothetical protein